jgi:hypothetical protein
LCFDLAFILTSELRAVVVNVRRILHNETPHEQPLLGKVRCTFTITLFRF